jgi:wyosine [tRNA(Phe)-imidazoG37] synthetase (radical SAM superfamily)
MIPMRTSFQKFNRAVSKVSLDRMTEIIKEFKNGTSNISGKI